MSIDYQKEFAQTLETVVYGCHAELRDKVRAIFEKHNLFTFFFAEYFLDEPVTGSDGLDQRRIFFPFLQSAVSELKFRVESLDPVPVGDNAPAIPRAEFTGKDRNYLKLVRDVSREGILLSHWASQKKRIADYLSNRTWELEEPLGIEKIEKYRVGVTTGDLKEDREAKISYDIQLHLWVMGEVSKSTPVRVIRIPISSRRTYYGHFLVVYQTQDQAVAERLRKDLERRLNMLALERYVPTLVLLHASKWEKRLRKASGILATVTPSPVSLGWENSPDEFESAFGRLWQERGISTTAQVLETIILDEYHIASPAMVKQVQEVIRGAKLMRPPDKKGKPLPTALVFGEAGSGKDKMARLIPTFTSHYLNAQITTQNMAALKPSQLAIPLMFGAELPKSASLPGVFTENPSPKTWLPFMQSWLGSRTPKPRAFILDELNSLDYDMQGSLLRLLENSEVAPLFSTEEPKWIDALIVGIVNEDPEEVTRENELRLLKDAEEFLGKAETARLYDALLHARRLRPDLVYRLKRGIYVRLPALRERWEDIPLLFKYPCTKHLETLCKGYFGENVKVKVDGAEKEVKLQVTVEFELEAYDVLMRRDLPWPGNIRQLETVARRAADEVWDWWKKKNKEAVDTRTPPNGGQIEIDVQRPQVERVLRKEFPKQMGHEEAVLGQEDAAS